MSPRSTPLPRRQLPCRLAASLVRRQRSMSLIQSVNRLPFDGRHHWRAYAARLTKNIKIYRCTRRHWKKINWTPPQDLLPQSGACFTVSCHSYALKDDHGFLQPTAAKIWDHLQRNTYCEPAHTGDQQQHRCGFYKIEPQITRRDEPASQRAIAHDR